MDKLAILGGSPAVSKPIPPYNSLGQEEVAAAGRVVASGRLSEFVGEWGGSFQGGEQVRAFEKEWSEYFGVPHSVSMNSATSGLIAAVGACGIGPGDEVIVSAFTMTASASCVRVFGGTPVFADVDAELFTLSPSSIERCLTPRTKAIIVVDLAGQAGDMDEILAIARPRGIRVIEDAAQAPGARYGNRWAGTLADIGVFSLNYHKTIQTGEGGVCCTRDPDLATRLQLVRNHGEAVVEGMGYGPGAEQVLGFNFRLGEVEAAIGREQLKKLDRLTRPRVAVAREFDRRLGALPGLRVPKVGDRRSHVYYIYMMKVDEAESGFTRRQLVRALEAEGVPSYEGYCRPLYLQPLYRPDWPGKNGRVYATGLCPVTEALYERELFYMAHLHAEVRDTALDDICRAFEKIWAQRDLVGNIGDDGQDPIRCA